MDDVQLVLLAQTGDRDAFHQLLRHMYPSLLRYATGLVGNTAAEDVVQDAAILIHKNLKWLREPAYFRPWAYRIASRLAIAHLRRTRRWEPLDEHAESAGENAFAGDFEAKFLWNEQIHVLAKQLSPASRAVFLLHYQHEHTLDEISAVLEIPIGTVKSRLFYAVKQLRARLAKEEQYG